MWEFQDKKCGHYGSNNSTNEKLLDIIKPEIAAISADRNNTYGHPHKEIIERLEEYNIQYYVTNKVGAIEVTSDGSRYWADTYIK